ncbi:MAG: radical SAM protein [Candidatus Thermoplasmatota archaeon]|nr:radical SAM protein [Candidatus Thermoplasmatota archaeon]
MNRARSLLPQYFSILKEHQSARYLACKHRPVTFRTSQPTEHLWVLHQNALQSTQVQNTIPEQSLLDLKIELAHRLYTECCLCEHRCGVDRTRTTGVCGVQEPRIASEFLHFGEEEPLVPSYTVFFSGCTFQCVFCQNWDISQHHPGVTVEPARLGKVIEQRKRQGARNVNWVGGDPTSNLLYILQVLRETEVNLPQVWNSNMYCSVETMHLLQGVIDVYLTDFKYGNDACAERLSKVKRYLEVVQRNHLLAASDAEVIIRHLVMPNHGACCSQPLLHWIHQNMPGAAVNIMGQYHPRYHADEYEDIAQPVSKEQYYKIRVYADTLGLCLL